ncbi:beta-alanine-activating enzyme-like [Amphiura filiformis]|uniref:beta-alanine-activating enzyme-like n=1 Tax=Amphiura filiformis TaxID=82378 RepID=UPI003B21601C
MAEVLSTNQTSLYSLFELAAMSHPYSIATMFDDGDGVTMSTYQDVLKSSGIIAELLMGIGWNDQCVGMYCMVTRQIPAIILGILQVPCCFVPLDPKAPSHITSHVISSIGLEMVLVQISHLQNFHDTIGQQWDIELCPACDKFKEFGFVLIQIHQQVNKDSSREDTGLAYVMHTSGTTGKPKIIRVPHQCIVPNILHLRKTFNIRKYDVIFNAATLTFDTSIVEIFLALSQGASLLMVPTAIKLMPRKLMSILMRNHVTVIQATPTLIRRFDPSLLRAHLFSDNTPLRLMIFGGEPCPTPAVIHQWCSKNNKTDFYNIYGITEVSCWASLYRIPNEDIHNDVNQSVPIGDPLDDTIIEVRDKHGIRVSHGCGTVFIGGTQRFCYLENEEASVESKTVMRDTGDLVEATKRGHVCIGRQDDQIKRHGKRITLTQIQQSVEMLDCVSSCAAVLNKQQLLLFCVPTDKQISPIPQCISHSHPLLSQLQGILPSHGMPDNAFWVSNFPVTLHGKLDRPILCEIAKDAAGSVGSVESNDVREKLYQLWQMVLPHGAAIDDISNFLQLGGDSFQAVHMASQMELWCKRPLPDFVDNLLHKCFGDIVVYVQDCFSKQETIQDVNSGHTLEYGEGHERKPSDVHSDCTNQDTSSPDALSHKACNFLCTCCYAAVRRGSQVTFCRQQACRSDETNARPLVDAGLPWKPEVIQMRWKYDTGKCVDASPLVVRWRSKAVVYIGSHSHKFAAISMETGDALWESTLGDRVESSACLSACGKYVVVGCYDSHVYFLDCNSGFVYWKYKTRGPVKSSPVADSDSSLVYIGSHDQHLYALCTKDKTCVWQIHCGGGSVFSSPVISYQTQSVYVGTLCGNLLAVTKSTGQLQWNYKCPKPIFSSPVISAIGVIVGCADGSLYCISYTGTTLWTFETQAPIFSSPCVYPSTPSKSTDCNNTKTQYVVFGSHDHYVYCVDNIQGGLLWKTELKSQVYATSFIFESESFQKRLNDHRTVDKEGDGRKRLIVKETSSSNEPIRKCVRLGNEIDQPMRDHVNSVSDQNPNELHPSNIVDNLFVVVACTSGTVSILDISTGGILSSYELPGEVFSSPVVENNTIVIGCRDDFVYCLDII